tara:strand:- start:4242 stop:4457 length:216 start_codon:yes stop_codon:yes gene_type:complete
MKDLKTFKEFLNESSINEEYIELMEIDEPLEMLKKAWENWRKGPMTEPSDIKPAQKELKSWIDNWFKQNIK